SGRRTRPGAAPPAAPGACPGSGPASARPRRARLRPGGVSRPSHARPLGPRSSFCRNRSVRLSVLARRPALTVLVGAVAIAFSGVLYERATVSPSTGAFSRCLWALPPLWLIARWERRRFGPRPARSRYYAWIAGGFFAADLIFWHNSIEHIGAGLA